MSDEIASLKAEIAKLRTTLEAAKKFKVWALDVMAKNNISFVGSPQQEDYTSSELSSNAASCVCDFCGEVDPLKASSCPMQKCSQCGHGMRPNRFGLPRFKQ